MTGSDGALALSRVLNSRIGFAAERQIDVP
jgi:hypothetical protein